MPPARRAVVDIGTNSVKLLVADVAEGEVIPVFEGASQTRLGHGFYEAHRLRPDAVSRTAGVVTEFAKTANGYGATSVRIIATSAVREARNHRELTSAILQACGIEVEVISGEQEAEWAFKGATSDPKLAREPLLLLDVGGGSTEFILGQGDTIHFRQSFPLGVVRLMESIPHSDPPKNEELNRCREWLQNFMANEVGAELGPALKQETKLHGQHQAARLVGVGGTATILARMESAMEDWNGETIEATRLTLGKVQGCAERLWGLPLAERRQIPGLPRERADVILTGVVIYEAVMRHFGFAELRVSTRGLRFAAVMDGG